MDNERSREVLTSRGSTVGPANSSSLSVSKILSNKVQGDLGRLTLRRQESKARDKQEATLAAEAATVRMGRGNRSTTTLAWNACVKGTSNNYTG